MHGEGLRGSRDEMRKLGPGGGARVTEKVGGGLGGSGEAEYIFRSVLVEVNGRGNTREIFWARSRRADRGRVRRILAHTLEAEKERRGD